MVESNPLKDAIWHYMDEKTVAAYGPWVRHADYTALEAENTRLAAEVERLREGRVKALETPETKGPYEARSVVGGMPTECCDYGVVSLSEGREVCRVWREQDARAISEALSALSEPSQAEPTIAGIFADLAARQEPLGVDLGDYEDLYERDEPRAPAEPGEPQTTDDLDELIRRHREGIVAWADARHPECAHIPHPDRAPLAEPGEAEAALAEALDKLLTLTKFDLGDNASRQPWKRAIERCDAARRTLKGENNGNG